MVIYFLRNILPFISFAIFCRSFGTPLAIYTSRDDAAGIASSLAAGEEAAQADMLQGVAVAHDADGCRRAGLHGYHHGVVGQEAMGVAAKLLEAFGQTPGDERGQPEVQGRSNQAGGVRRLG